MGADRGRQKEDLCLRRKDRWEECCNISVGLDTARLRKTKRADNGISVLKSFKKTSATCSHAISPITHRTNVKKVVQFLTVLHFWCILTR